MGLTSKIAKTLNMLLPCGHPRNVSGASNDLSQLAEKLKKKASELGSCLKCIEDVFCLTRPQGGTALEEWRVLRDVSVEFILSLQFFESARLSLLLLIGFRRDACE